MQNYMDWKNTLFDWNRARAFLVTAEEGSFSAASRALGLAQPTLGRQVTALEEELGVALFERVGNRLELTAVGLELVDHVRAMNESATQCSLIAAGQTQVVDGLVRISASEVFSAFLLPQIVAQIRALHPGIEVELVVSNAASDLRRREADIAIRHIQPQGDGLIARLVKEKSEAFLYATPQYLDSIDNPKSPESLVERGQVLGFDETDVLMKALHGIGLGFEKESFPVHTESHLVQWELARSGIGMCVMMSEIGDADPAFVRALPDFPHGFPFPTWLVSHRELRMNRRIRVVYDLLLEMLGQQLHQKG